MNQPDQKHRKIKEHKNDFKSAVAGGDEIGIATRKKSNQRARQDEGNNSEDRAFDKALRNWKLRHNGLVFSL
jgi:hypothetical protein